MIHPGVVYALSHTQMADGVCCLTCLSCLRAVNLDVNGVVHLSETCLKGNSPIAAPRVKSSVFAMIHLLMAVETASIPSPHSHCYPNSFT